MVFDRLLKNKIISDIMSPESLKQIKRYLITGFTSAALEITILFVLKDVLKLSVLLANTLALTIIFWFNFLMNRIYSFKSKSDIKKQLVMYGMLFAFNLAASDFIMYILTSLLYLQYLLAKVFAIGAVVSWNFVLYRKVIYKN